MGNIDPGKKDQKKKEESNTFAFYYLPLITRKTITKDPALTCWPKKEKKGC